MTTRRPSVVVLAGPNGAGKSTVAPLVLRGALDVVEFVNADDIARGLSPFNIEGAAVAAGRIMLARIRDLARQRVSFAFETTLASRTFAPWLKELVYDGYAIHLVYLWLPSPEVAAARVADRVRLGGHAIPDETIRRRYHGGIRNFFGLYRPIARAWVMYDSSHPSPQLIAEGEHDMPIGPAIRQAARVAIERHRQAGVEVVLWENGQIVYRDAGEVLAELDAKDSSAG